VLTGEHDRADDSKFDFDVVRVDNEGYLGDLRFLLELVRLNRGHDVLYYGKPMDSFGALGSVFTSNRVVSHVHGRETYIYIERLRSYVRKFFLYFGLRFVDDFISVSNFTAGRLRDLGIKEDRIEVVHNAVEFDRFYEAEAAPRSDIGVPEDYFLIITVARLDRKKSHDLVLEALEKLENTHYLIVGTGPERENLEEKAENLAVSDKVTFAGYVEEEKLPGYYKTSDLYVMPSRFIEETGNIETFGISFLEANAAGKAVIGADNGGMEESIKDCETGFLAETDPQDIRDKIIKLKEEDNLRSEMEENAVEWAREHDWPKIIDKIDEILEP